MAGKSSKTRYGEFRVLIEYKRRAKYGFRTEFIPSMAAYLLMIGRGYEKAVEGLKAALNRETVPGAAEAIATYETCQKNIQMLINSLAINFHRDDWTAAVEEVCKLFDIQPTSDPMPDIQPDAFGGLLTELDDGNNAR